MKWRRRSDIVNVEGRKSSLYASDVTYMEDIVSADMLVTSPAHLENS
jgi:hypothetical protein